MILDDVRIFTKVVEAGSFTRAATQLGIPKSTVSRRVAELEEHLGVRLLHRTTRKLTLTDAGQLYFSQTSRAIEDLRQAEVSLEEMQKAPRGVLRVTLPGDLNGIAARLFQAFQTEYPLVVVVVFSTGRRVDLVAEGYDVALRAGVREDSSMVSRKLLDSRLGVFASPEYLQKHGTPESLADIHRHACLCWGTEGTDASWKLSTPAGQQTVKVSGPLASNDFTLLLSACENGMGLALLPTFKTGPRVATRRLQRVLPQCSGGSGGLYVTYPSARHLSPKVRVFIDFASAWLKDDAHFNGVQN